MPKLLEAPFWLDPSDPHRMAAAMQIASRPTQYEYTLVSGDWRHDLVWQEQVWAKAVHRVAAEGITPEQGVDEAIARIKQDPEGIGDRHRRCGSGPSLGDTYVSLMATLCRLDPVLGTTVIRFTPDIRPRARRSRMGKRKPKG